MNFMQKFPMKAKLMFFYLLFGVVPALVNTMLAINTAKSDGVNQTVIDHIFEVSTISLGISAILNLVFAWFFSSAMVGVGLGGGELGKKWLLGCGYVRAEEMKWV